MIRQLLCLVALMSVTTAYEVSAAEKTPTQQALLQKAIKA